MNKVVLLNHRGGAISCDNPIETAANLIKQGCILGIKGVGGYHISCDATNAQVVEKLRTRKKRKDKPLAVMAKDMVGVEKICDVSPLEKEVLLGKEKPIILLKKKWLNGQNNDNPIIPEAIAPRQIRLGVMLPYTDIHKELFKQGLEFLVMTSANISGLPICYKDEDALEQLSEVVDYYLVHHQTITIPIDDSVVKVVMDKIMVSRCGRWYAPYEVALETNQEILAVGAEQKGSICVAGQGKSYLSQYLGDVKDYHAYKIYIDVMAHMKSLYHIEPTVYAHDLNRDYLSSQYAIKNQGIHIPVQHHHGHMASCMGEHDLHDEVIGVIFDGTGLGTDGCVWGGEFLVGSRKEYERVGHLQYVTLQGGEKVITQPWRSALCYLCSMDIEPKEILEEIPHEKIDVITQAIHHQINCFESSSMGRLFDAVAALTGIRTHITYDAQGAIELEGQIDKSVRTYYSYDIYDENQLIIGYKKIIKDVIEDMKKCVPVPIIAAKFHNSIANATVECVCKIKEKTGINKVVLSGGVFENIYLLEKVYMGLIQKNFDPYFNHKIPINDAGIAYGQAVVAAEILKE